MGYGDSILLSGIAKRMHAMTNQRVCPVDAKWNPYWDDLWNGLPYMMRELYMDGMPLRNGPSVRQYYSGMEGSRILWRKWDVAPGEIRLTDEEREWARTSDLPKNFLVINPDWKRSGGGGGNKNWGFEKWLRVTEHLDGVELVHLGSDPPWLGGTVPIRTPTFRLACAILERSIGYVGHEGGLHHAAAALGKPAVVVFGGYISPEITGYSTHRNLYVEDPRYPLGCGETRPCQHCREAMEKITVKQVVEAVKEIL